MVLRYVARAVIASAVGMVLLLASSSQAAAVDAATFLAACPGPIFIDTDTTLTGSATISGDCTLSSPAVGPGTPQINLNKATLTFTGSFQIVGNASSVTVDKSKVTTGGEITLDSLGPMAITGSTLTAKGGAITLPPRNNLTITSSTLSAQSDVTLGGPGGSRQLTDSAISAGGAIIIKPGGSPASLISLLRASLSSDSISLGGSLDTFSVADSTLQASGGDGILMAPGGAEVMYDIKATKLTASAGPIFLGGAGSYSIETSKLFSGAPADSAGIVVGERGGASIFQRTQFKTKQSGIQFFGTGSPVFEDCIVQAGGQESGLGILVGRGSPPSIIASKFQARAGGIRIVGSGDASITGSTLQAKHPSGLVITNGGARSIIRSTLDSPLGPVELSGIGDTDIVGSKVSANAGGMLLTCGGSSDIDSSKLLTKGLLSIPNGQGSTVAASNITANGGFITETGISGSGDSNVSANTIKASSITVRSFQTTTVIDNTMSAKAFEFSSTGTCTSASNKPDIPCF